MAEGWMKPILDDEPIISSKPINGTLFDISAAAKKNAGNQLRQDLNPKYSKHNISSPGNWRCHSCNFLNFPRRIVCVECNQPKKGGRINLNNNNTPPNAVAILYPKGTPDPDPYADRSVILSEEGFHVAEKSKKSRREALRQEALKRETTRLGSIKIQSNTEAEESNLDQFHENFLDNDFTKKQPPYNHNVTAYNNKVDDDTVEYDTDSEDSFYSVRTSFSCKKDDDDDGGGQEVSSDDPLILLENLGENIKTLSGNSYQERNLKIVTQLLLETDYKAQSLKLVSNYGIYSICSKILEQHHSGPILVKYLQFFTKVIQTALQEEPKKYSIEQIISVKVDMFELFGRFLSLVEHFMPRRLSDSPRNDSIDKELIETLLQIIKTLALKDCIQNLFNLRSFRFYNFIHEWLEFNPGKKWKLVRDVMLTISKYFYENNFKSGKKPLRGLMDIFVADLCIKYLRPPKHNKSEDHLYLLYHILSYMPLTNVRSVFKANNLDLLIQMIEKELKTSQKDELALIARKILDFPNSNFLSEEQSTNESKDESYIPLEDYSKTGSANYRGVFKSTSDLPYDFDSYNDQAYEKMFKQRLDALETNVCNFKYNFLFDKSVLEENGFEVAFLDTDQNPDRNEIGAHICAFLNSLKPGILLIGIHTSNTGSHLIQGVVLDRKQRDNYRIGLDRLIKELSDGDSVQTCFDRFDPPTFNVVSHYPGVKEEAYVVIIRINPPKVKNNLVTYKFRGHEYLRRNGDTVKNLNFARVLRINQITKNFC